MSETRPAWLKLLKTFERPSRRSATWQILNSLVPYFALGGLMYLTILWGLPYWVTLLVSLPTAGFLIRMFIFFHDCCHGSFLASRRAMRFWGNLFGIMTFTPFADWRYTHGQHHSTFGNLDRRGLGDVWTMTAAEFSASPRWKRFIYRAYRHPIIMFGFGPIFLFLVFNRFPEREVRSKTGWNVHFTNLAIAAMVVGWSLLLGFGTYVKIQLPVIYFAGLGGIWLFYVQHQFDPSYWARDDEWNSVKAALEGSSFYKLPAVLKFFSGNIGFHHVHHLRPRIPNYNLEKCMKAIPQLQNVRPLTLWRSLKSVRLHIWDEAHSRLLSFREYSRMMRNRGRGGVPA
jgi:omega-6 fatty acid desaturase (delta-12 desaturase)